MRLRLQLLRLPTQSVRYEVEEGVAQQTAGGEAEQHLQQVLVLVTVGLNWDQEQDEERRRADQQGRPDGLEEEERGQEALSEEEQVEPSSGPR